MTTRSKLALSGITTAFLLAACNRDPVTSREQQAEQQAPKVSTTEEASKPTTAEAISFREDPGNPSSPKVQSAIARLIPTEGNDAKGIVRFSETDEGLEVHGDFEGLPAGKHAYHVHLYGDCAAPDAKSAGTHFNFEGSAKNPGSVERITGNLGEVTVDASGKGSAEAQLAKASLSGPYSILGRAVVVHEKGNDPKSPPMGAAGSRLACGVIGIDEPE
jgi:Cu-Zn family superoxide dismutase